jgi:molybdopterin converting factor small subunit
MQIIIEYGLNSLTKDVQAGATVSDLVNDENIQAALGFGENVDVLVDNVVVGSYTVLSDGDEIVVRAKANAKA